MELLEASIKALEIVNLAADKIPIPGLSTAVGCALSIAKKAKVRTLRPHSYASVVTCTSLRISKILGMPAALSPSVLRTSYLQYTSSSKVGAATRGSRSMSRCSCCESFRAQSLYHSYRAQSNTRNLQDIENLMDRRLRPRMRDRIRFVFSRDKIADEVKVLTMRLEDSFRMFMV